MRGVPLRENGDGSLPFRVGCPFRAKPALTVAPRTLPWTHYFLAFQAGRCLLKNALERASSLHFQNGALSFPASGSRSCAATAWLTQLCFGRPPLLAFGRVLSSLSPAYSGQGSLQALDLFL